MKTRLLVLLISSIALLTLYGCSAKENDEQAANAVETEVEGEEPNNEDGEVDDEPEQADGHNTDSHTLPDGFPTDFPLPDGMIITEVEDESDAERYSFDLRFDFNPDLDMAALFEEYDEYAEGLEYNTIADGEEVFADGIFQFGATSKFSANNMFLITLQVENPHFGAIKVKISK